MLSLISSLLAKDVKDRLGCGAGRTADVKGHVFFVNIDWSQVYQLKLTPPLVPSRGIVNAADTIDIGTFGSEDSKQRVKPNPRLFDLMG